MKVSVVMATYNGEKYILEQMDSICSQLQESDELIICDDCSTDRTVDVIREHIEKNNLQSVVKLFCNEKNLGFENNFNKCLSYAQGDYIFFADQDDIWHNNKIKVMLSVMNEKKDCQVLCCDYEPFACTNDAPTPPKNLRKRMPDDGSVDKIRLTKKTMYIGALGCCMCMRKEFRESIEEYWFDGWAQDDRCWRMALCGDGLYVLHQNLVRHRLHSNNTSTYGKYHSVKKRTFLFETMQKADFEMLRWIKENTHNKYYEKVVSGNAKMLDMRIDLLLHRKFSNCLLLLYYLSYYQTLKSYLVEIVLAIKESVNSKSSKCENN